jgi:hypothetical protein
VSAMDERANMNPKVIEQEIPSFDPPKMDPVGGSVLISIPKVKETRYSVRVNSDFVQRIHQRLGSNDWSWPAKSHICEEIIAEYLAVRSKRQ